jgi:hypothetical protein
MTYVLETVRQIERQYAPTFFEVGNRDVIEVCATSCKEFAGLTLVAEKLARTWGLGALLGVSIVTALPWTDTSSDTLPHQNWHRDGGRVDKKCVTIFLNLCPVGELNGYTEFRPDSKLPTGNMGTGFGDALFSLHNIEHRGRANCTMQERKMFLMTFKRL